MKVRRWTETTETSTGTRTSSRVVETFEMDWLRVAERVLGGEGAKSGGGGNNVKLGRSRLWSRVEEAIQRERDRDGETRPGEVRVEPSWECASRVSRVLEVLVEVADPGTYFRKYTTGQ